MSQPLNPQLYNALEKRIGGPVRIANEGERYTPGWPGEYYCVNCPYCGDTRQRLWINHMFGVVTIKNGRKDDHLNLAYCYNEEGACFSDYSERRAFYDRVFPFDFGRRRPLSELPVVAQPVAVPAGPAITTVARPTGLIYLHDPRAARAAGYLASRGFDPAELSQKWGVMYDPRQDRIAIPIHHLLGTFQAGGNGMLMYNQIEAGWQYRYIGDPPPNVPKYLTSRGCPKSRLLYGLENASGADRWPTPRVVVEGGGTDTWVLGGDCVATLGKSISRAQVNLLVEHAENRTIVVAYDREAAAESQVAAYLIRKVRREYGQRDPVVVLTLPSDRNDIGECTRQEAWAAVWAAACPAAS